MEDLKRSSGCKCCCCCQCFSQGEKKICPGKSSDSSCKECCLQCQCNSRICECSNMIDGKKCDCEKGCCCKS